MRPAPRHRRHLVNTTDIEVWPGGLLRARNNRDDRLLSRARHVLRRKRDGRYLAAVTDDGFEPMVHRIAGEPGLTEARHALAHRVHRRSGVEHVRTLPLARLASRLEALGLDADEYAGRTGLALVPEPDWLQSAGRDRYARPLWLRVDAAAAWARMRAAALRDDVVLEAISGYRSHDYQLGIFERKRARGLSVDDILAVNAAPGFSEHHSGCALDIGAPGEPPAEESFEGTDAFAWLSRNAGAHGFTMSYPRDNPHGIVYEPWHWAFSPRRDD
jgi:D-alanyl-D-alanine carboxypeptidase